MGSNPLISVIVTSYNYGKYIGQTINSVLSQIYDNFELIIVDDASCDDSADIIRSFDDNRITFIPLEKNEGYGKAQEKSFSVCKGDLIISLDSDDFLSPDAFDTQVKFLRDNPEIDILGTYITEINADGNVSSGVYEDWFNCKIDLNKPESWIWQNRLCHSSVVIKRKVHEELGLYNNELIYSPDYDFWIRAHIYGFRFAVLPEKLLYYRNHGENITKKSPLRHFWEYAYISKKTLHPYLKKCNMNNFINKNIQEFLNNEAYLALEDGQKAKLFEIFFSADVKNTCFSEIYAALESEPEPAFYDIASLIGCMNQDIIWLDLKRKEITAKSVESYNEIQDLVLKYTEKEQALIKAEVKIQELNSIIKKNRRFLGLLFFISNIKAKISSFWLMTLYNRIFGLYRADQKNK